MDIRRIFISTLLVAILLLSQACNANKSATEPPPEGSVNKSVEEPSQKKSPPPPPPNPAPTWYIPPERFGTVQFYVTATQPPEGVTSVQINMSGIMVSRQSPERKEMTIGTYLEITENTYVVDLSEMNGLKKFLGTSKMATGDYTDLSYSVDKVKLALVGGEMRDAQFPLGDTEPPSPVQGWVIQHPFTISDGETKAIIIRFDTARSVQFQENAILFLPWYTDLIIRTLIPGETIRLDTPD